MIDNNFETVQDFVESEQKNEPAEKLQALISKILFEGNRAGALWSF